VSYVEARMNDFVMLFRVCRLTQRCNTPFRILLLTHCFGVLSIETRWKRVCREWSVLVRQLQIWSTKLTHDRHIKTQPQRRSNDIILGTNESR
jgi:hypothetical protein